MPGTRTLSENVRRYWGAIPVALAIALLVLRALLHTPPLDNLAPAPSLPGDPPGTRAYAGYVMIARGGRFAHVAVQDALQGRDEHRIVKA